MQELYNANKDKQQGDYTDEIWSAFVAALEQANNVLDNPEAIQKDVDKAYEDLLNAVSGLKEESCSSSSGSSGGSSSKPSESTGGSDWSGTDSPNTDATTSPLPILVLAASAGVMAWICIKKKVADQ